MELRHTAIPGCFEIIPFIFQDLRGTLVKTFVENIFVAHKMETHFAEEFHSLSSLGVLRGLHFQLPPHEQTKLVYCVSGAIFDAVVDLRVGSPMYGSFVTYELSAENGKCLYLSPGLAHGFLVLTQTAIVMYRTSAAYVPEYDCGIRWDSAGIPWPMHPLMLSKRDSELPRFVDFSSPFVYPDK